MKKYFLSEKWDYNLKCHAENGNCVLEARLQVLLGEVQGQCLCSSCPYLQQHRRNKHQYRPLKEKIYFHINGLFLHPRGLQRLFLGPKFCHLCWRGIKASRVANTCPILRLILTVKSPEMARTKQTQLPDNTLHFLEKLSFGLIMTKLIILISLKRKEIG